jgi:hypothetical protein
LRIIYCIILSQRNELLFDRLDEELNHEHHSLAFLSHTDCMNLLSSEHVCIVNYVIKLVILTALSKYVECEYVYVHGHGQCLHRQLPVYQTGKLLRSVVCRAYLVCRNTVF